MAALLLGSFDVGAQSQERDVPTISLRKGYTLSKKLARVSNDALPLLLKMAVPREPVLAGENFTLSFTITNPNPMALRLSVAGRYRPSLYAGLSDEELWLFVEESLELQVGGRVIVLASGESTTMTYTVCPYLDAVLPTLYAERGYALRLRGAGVVEATSIEEPGCPMVMCKWESEELQVPVRAPTTRERRAYQAIVDWNEAHRVTAPGMSQEEWTLASVEFRRKFLEEYGDTPYANQIRVLLLRDLVHLPRQRSGGDTEKLPPFFPLYVKTVSELLDAGVPYASKVDREVLETFCMARRWDLVVGVLDKLLAINPSERTLDRTLASVSRDFGDLPRLQAKGYLSEGKETEDLEAVAVRCIERCAAWTGYRAVPFDRRTLAFLSEIKRWDLLELTSQRTLDLSRSARDCGAGPPSRHIEVNDETIAAAKEALNLAQRERDKR